MIMTHKHDNYNPCFSSPLKNKVLAFKSGISINVLEFQKFHGKAIGDFNVYQNSYIFPRFG